MRREVIEKRNIPVRTFAQPLAVDPHIAILIDAVELDRELLVFVGVGVGIGQVEALAIPANASRQICAAKTGRLFLPKRSFDTPVVGKVQGTPIRVRKLRHLRTREIASTKLPAKVKTNATPGHNHFGLRLRVAGADD